MRDQSIIDLILRRYRDTHRDALTVVAELDDAQFNWRPEHGPQSIAWQLWHIGRWDDCLAEVLIARTPALAAHRTTQIWSRDDLASRWGLDSAELGLEDGGTGLTWQQASEIRLPGRQEVSAYAAAAFHDVEEAVALLDERLLMLTLPGPTLYPSQSEPDTYGGNVLIWIEHNREHVGVIQALRGMQGLTGGLD